MSNFLKVHAADNCMVLIVNTDSPVTEELLAGVQFTLMNLCPQVEHVYEAEITLGDLADCASIIREELGYDEKTVDNHLKGVRTFVLDHIAGHFGLNYLSPDGLSVVVEHLLVDKVGDRLVFDNGQTH